MPRNMSNMLVDGVGGGAAEEMSATTFAVLFSLVQWLFSAVLSLVLGYLSQTFGLQNVMFWPVTVPYAINALYWFVFYGAYPRDVAAQQARKTTHVSV